MNLKDLLKDASLRITPVRANVVKQLAGHKYALSATELEETFEDIDRVTLYRTLKTFEEKGIIHRIMDKDGIARYALCEHECSAHHHHDDHIHFNCTSCGHVYCIEDTFIPKPKLPKGYEAASFQFTATGICNVCTKDQLSI